MHRLEARPKKLILNFYAGKLMSFTPKKLAAMTALQPLMISLKKVLPSVTQYVLSALTL
jgi:hypothetical protein